jgi:hypothetical protein
LRRAGAEDADLFLALTEGDNRNIMAAQLGIEALGARRTISKVNDPVRAEAYAHLGIATLCRTNLMMTAVLDHLGQASPARPGIQAPEKPHVHAGGAGADAGGAAGGAGASGAASAGGAGTKTEG